jgi:hypothetical protein
MDQRGGGGEAHTVSLLASGEAERDRKMRLADPGRDRNIMLIVRRR